MVSSPSSPESGGPSGAIRPPVRGPIPTPPPLPGSAATSPSAPTLEIALNGSDFSNRDSVGLPTATSSAVGLPTATSSATGLPTATSSATGVPVAEIDLAPEPRQTFRFQQSGAGPPTGGQGVVNGPNRQPTDRPPPTGLAVIAGNALALGTFWQQVPSWLLSTVFHLGFILILASYTAVGGLRSGSGTLATLARGDGDVDSAGLDDSSLDTAVESAPAGNELEEALQPTTTGALASDALNSPAALFPMAPSIDNPLSAMSVPVGTAGVTGATGGGAAAGAEGDLLGGIANSIGSSLQGRLSAANRARLVGSGGGTLASEEAVGLSLKWLSEHQNSDGSWSFAHQSSPHCAGRCGNPGHQGQAMVASTALGLLPFLGAGETHRQGRYKRNVDMALHYLGRAMHQLGGNGSLWEQGGRFYGHGLASIALCEAYGMTRDNTLEGAAQKSIDFIVACQDPIGGGWRYNRQQSGDTSVVGWQMMALKSANMAYLKVPPDTIRKAGYFLDSVQDQDGAVYGYLGPGRGPATSAIGLLCRMYMGWQHDRPALVRGVGFLAENGPSLDDSGPPRNNMYYNYYGTQVLHHYGGYEWVKWNAAMRDYLVATQGKTGHEAGSWYFEGTDPGSPLGGRLYCTAMATMILEVYYRHLPLYTDQSTKDKFQ